MHFGSLFSGIGGLDLGLERAGMACRWQVEIDDYARRVLAKHWPDVPRYGDIREVTGHELERVDLIAGGFPCQDISNAGHRVGIGGRRSGLWSEFIRIVRVVRPQYVLVENVAALLVRGMGTVLGDLADSGYDAEWSVLPACALGAPHTRERLFIVAHAGREGWQWQRGGVQLPAYLHGEGHLHPWPTYQPDLARVVDGVPRRLDRLRGVGNAVVPQAAEYIGRRIIEAECA
jgi:DNA (cytosine-5)-methyltransferase 1